MLDSMGNMGGMDMSSDGMFRGTNSGLARLFWYLIAGVLGLFLLLRAISVSTVYHRFVDSAGIEVQVAELVQCHTLNFTFLDNVSHVHGQLLTQANLEVCRLRSLRRPPL